MRNAGYKGLQHWTNYKPATNKRNSTQNERKHPHMDGSGFGSINEFISHAANSKTPKLHQKQKIVKLKTAKRWCNDLTTCCDFQCDWDCCALGHARQQNKQYFKQKHTYVLTQHCMDQAGDQWMNEHQAKQRTAKRGFRVLGLGFIRV